MESAADPPEPTTAPRSAVVDKMRPPGCRSLADELVDDRALEDAEEDLLQHTDVVDELRQLVCSTELPANVALYGPWGSGKSSLANMLAARLKEKKIPFARFDAFKYADAPMRRLFLSRMAKELKVVEMACGEEREQLEYKFGEGLYSEQTNTDIPIPAASVLKLAWVFTVATLVAMFVIAGALALIAIPIAGDWSPDFKRLIVTTLPIGTVPAAIIAAVVTFASQKLRVTNTRAKPASEEEFEALFRDLVDPVIKQSKADRIVIFIDELDRCSSDEVVKTLDTVRTFLEVKPCVVVVAADQQVLERALEKKVRQETPHDARNPYYSSGSAYLDKIFNYQMSLPPLRARRLSKFALGLVEKRGGLWRHIDCEWVLLALIPTHVRSPRRVKALLNSFVLTHRLAERRAAEEEGPADVNDRAAEIAKLVCLRTEFPLFAADLTVHPRLPQFVLQMAQGEELPGYVSHDVKELARAYAERRLEVDVVLPDDVKSDPTGRDDRDDADTGQQELDGQPEDGDEANDPTDAEEDDDETLEGDEDAEITQNGNESIRQVQGQHLLDYLQRTEQVGEIGSDLVFLEGRGATFGLEPTRADALETAAVNGDRRAVSRQLAGAENESETQSMLRLLAQIVREAGLGPEAENALRVLLSAVVATGAAAVALTDELLRAFWTHYRHFELEGADLEGALILAVNASAQVTSADQLFREILGRTEILTNRELGLRLLGAGRRAIDAEQDRTTTLVAKWLDTDPSATADVLLQLPERDAEELLNRADRLLRNRVAARNKRIGQGTDEEGNARPDPDEVESLNQRSNQLSAATEKAIRGNRRDLAAKFAVHLLAADNAEARALAKNRIPGLKPISDEGLIDEVIVAARHYYLDDLPQWVNAIEPEALTAAHSEATLELVIEAWQDANASDVPSDKVIDAALVSLRRITQRTGLSLDSTRLQSEINDSVAGAALGTNDASAERMRTAAAKFTSQHIVEPTIFAAAFLNDALATLQLAALPEGDPASVARRIAVAARKYATSLAGSDLPQQIYDAARACAWLPAELHTDLFLQLAASVVAAGGEVGSPYPPEQVHELAAQRGPTGGVGAWVTTFASSLDDAYPALEPFAHDDPFPRPLVLGLIGLTKRLGAGVALEIAQRYYERHGMADPPGLSFLHYLGTTRPPAEDVADWIVGMFPQASNRKRRQGLMKAWQGLDPRGDAARKNLINEVFLPLSEESKDALKLVLSHIDLVRDPPYGPKGAIVSTLRDQGRKRRQRKQVENALARAGLISAGE